MSNPPAHSLPADKGDDELERQLLTGVFVIGSGLLTGVLAWRFGRNMKGKAMDYRNIQAAQTYAHRWASVFRRVTPEMLMGIMGIESSFNPSDVNTSPRAAARGMAWGLMQITFNTALDEIPKLRTDTAKFEGAPRAFVDNALKLWDGQPRSLLSPDLNVMVGAYYLDKLMGDFNNDVDLAVTAYQQGPYHMLEALKKGATKEQILAQVGPNGREYLAMYQNKVNELEGVV